MFLKKFQSQIFNISTIKNVFSICRSGYFAESKKNGLLHTILFCYNLTVNSFEQILVGKPAKWLVDAAASADLDISGLTHEVTNYFKSHSIKRHGNAETERAQGQLPVTGSDFDQIPEIVKNPDYAIVNIKRSGGTVIAYAKKLENETIIYLEEVLNSKRNKSLRSKTIFKKMGFIKMDTFLKIMKANAHTDMSKAKIVVGAGGHPGDET
jgi:hypothetical protein